jgi:hydroxyacylglutathione hydrolase
VSHDLAADELLRQMSSGRAPFVLDVRTRVEFNAGHVPGAANMPFWLVPFRASALPVRPDDPIVVYCGHGPRAQLATVALRARGFTRIACLAGHWAEWRASGRPEQREEPGKAQR